SRGNLYLLASATQIITDRGWIDSTGDVRIKWRASQHAPQLKRGDLIEDYGWLKSPDTALNPGGFDPQQVLAADRVLAEIRIPRPSGIIPLQSSSDAAGPDALTRLRLFLRAKLLAHTAQIDVEAGYSMVALLLG